MRPSSTPNLQTTTKMPQRRQFGREISGNARTTTRLTPGQRTRIIAKSEAGCGTKELAEEFRVTPKCMRDTLQRWQLHHTTKDLPRSGRPKILLQRDERVLFRMARKYPKMEYRQLLEGAALTNRISAKTAYRALKRYDPKKFRCKRRPKITRLTAGRRRAWEREWRHFDWKRRTMRFSDECAQFRKALVLTRSGASTIPTRNGGTR